MSGTLDDFAEEHGTTDDAGESMQYDGEEAKKLLNPRLRGTGDHLTFEKPDTGVKLEADPKRSEIWCDKCENRVTVGPDGDEYGHKNTCQFSTWEPQQ